MAPLLRKATIGKHVYIFGKPRRAGIIVPGERVLWLDGSETDIHEYSLCDLDALIEDHEKKLKTHRATLERLDKLCSHI